MICVKGLVSGRVQGVGFRYYVMHQAEDQRLSGYVRNLADGRVEFLLQGPRESVETVLTKIRNGPKYAQVSDCVVEESDPESLPQGFEIR